MILQDPKFWLLWALFGDIGLLKWKVILDKRGKVLGFGTGFLLLLFFIFAGVAGIWLSIVRDPEDFIKY